MKYEKPLPMREKRKNRSIGLDGKADPKFEIDECLLAKTHNLPYHFSTEDRSISPR